MPLATGLRIGECLALTYADVSFTEKRITVEYNLAPIKGQGLRRMKTKTPAGRRRPRLPGWAMVMLERRYACEGDGPIFRNADGGWRDPSNTSRAFREARTAAGFGWVTSHVFRKTVATVLDSAGVPAREIADQLGHTKVSMTTDVYLDRSADGGAAAAALELADPGAGKP